MCELTSHSRVPSPTVAAGAVSSCTPAVADLIRATVARVVDRAPALFAQLHDAVAASAPEALLADPALAAEIERSNVVILAAWLEANLRQPGERVDPVLSADTLDIVRDVARRGLEDSTYNYFRVGQGVAAQYVMQAAFEESSEPALLRDALGIMLSSAAEYIDRSVTALREVIEQERKARATGGRTLRLEIVTTILGGEAIDTAQASARLGFELGRPLLGAILWTDPSSGLGIDALERLARRLADACGSRPPLLVPATTASLWAWLPTSRPAEPAALRTLVAQTPGVRVAIGSSAAGVAGFRRGHLDALQAQRVMHRHRVPLDFATHEDVRAVALAGGDEPAAAEFIAVTLGALAVAAPQLRYTLRAVIAAGFDTGRAAADLGLHRNSVLARLRRARPLLPAGHEERWIDVALALELDHWLGDQPP